jgi:23S rRNA (cytidine2498-2'-O)-methyltransferase
MSIESNTPALLGYCRAGFEPELVAEFTDLAKSSPIALTAATASGFVHAVFKAKARPDLRPSSGSPLMFARQWLIADAEPVLLPTLDRVTPIVAAAQVFLEAQGVPAVCAVWIEYPDTNDGKSLSKLSLAVHGRIEQQLRQHGLIDAKAPLRLHVLLSPDRKAWLGLTDSRHASPWPLGIPRIRMPREAPSRSTLKLAEALQVFLGTDEAKLLQPDMRAVDLGAAPGGWTWQLINRGLHVSAVDNGPLKGDLVDNAMVKHLRMDGFRYIPKKQVDWMVCDMVEKPSRIAQLVAQWLTERWARHIIFNLKLPMKKRYEEVLRCKRLIEEAAEAKDLRADVRIRQLYHDREEVTGYVTLVSRRK